VRIAGIVLTVIGVVAVLLGMAGYVATTVQHADIQCPGAVSCIDRLMGTGSMARSALRACW
jgi:hypothetical protein